jgi:hypothetical protein
MLSRLVQLLSTNFTKICQLKMLKNYSKKQMKRLRFPPAPSLSHTLMSSFCPQIENEISTLLAGQFSAFDESELEAELEVASFSRHLLISWVRRHSWLKKILQYHLKQSLNLSQSNKMSNRQKFFCQKLLNTRQ